MRTLAGKHAIITGGSRGIGLAIARLFASEGASISLVGRDETTLQEALRSLPQETQSGQALEHDFHVFNVAQMNEWYAMHKKMKRPVDILVNAAGITQNSFLFKTGAEAVSDIVKTNLMGTIWGCQSTSRKMMAQNSGCIINVSSLLATHGGRGASVYAASKAGIVGLTRSLAWELGRFGVRINVLLPGYIQTDMTKSLDKEGELSALIPMGRLGLVEEVAHAAAFLAKNPYAHNTVLNLDGGLSAT
ncbi:hypothetical protein BJ170DRAFT_485898 [Xylariales sp. AK1849]|nr:hypothetical protein BJ170DRAFT_485898 [Xylariales sp. AK1849]